MSSEEEDAKPGDRGYPSPHPSTLGKRARPQASLERIWELVYALAVIDTPLEDEDKAQAMETADAAVEAFVPSEYL